MKESFDLLRRAAATVGEPVAVIAFAWMCWQTLFGGTQPFQSHAFAVGLIGTVVSLALPGAKRQVPWPLVMLVAWALFLAWVHGTGAWQDRLARAEQYPIMLLFVFAGAHVLRSWQRLAVFAVAFGGAVLFFATQVLFDRVSTNFEYVRGGPASLPDVAQWGGLHQVGFVLVTGFPFVAFAMVQWRRPLAAIASAVLALALMVVAFFNGSLSALMAMALAAGGMFLVVLLRRLPLKRALPALVILAVALVILAGPAWRFLRYETGGGATSTRVQIWIAAMQIVLDHPWLGVGPGGYPYAMVDGGYHARFLGESAGGAEQAHNYFLHAAAELGWIGAALAVLVWLWFSRAALAGWSLGRAPVLALGVLFALIGIGARLMTDNFLDGLDTSSRSRVLVWMIFAAALAVARLNDHEAAPAMPKARFRLRRWQFAAAGIAIVAVEAWLLFASRGGSFVVHGARRYDVTELSAGVPISQAFYMSGNGLHAVQLQFGSNRPSTIAIDWTLSRGSRDEPPMSVVSSGRASIDVGRGRRWTTFDVLRDSLSNNRWYTIEVRLVDQQAAAPGAEPPIAYVLATHDNPDRGGVLWIGDRRATGSIVMRADRADRTLYRRFVSDLSPNLLGPFREPSVQWLIVVAVHLAFFQWAYFVLTEQPGSPRSLEQVS